MKRALASLATAGLLTAALLSATASAGTASSQLPSRTSRSSGAATPSEHPVAGAATSARSSVLGVPPSRSGPIAGRWGQHAPQASVGGRHRGVGDPPRLAHDRPALRAV